MENVYAESPIAASQLAAGRIVEIVLSDRTLRSQRPLRLAFPGGRSISPLLGALAAVPFPWDQSVVFLADERVVPAGDSHRNDAQVVATLEDAGLEPASGRPLVVPPPIEPTDPDRSASAYTMELGRYNDALDLIILGVGEDGHVASLFPDSSQTASQARGYLPVTDSPKPPPQRITVSPATIQAARLVVLLAFGEAKQDTRSRIARAAGTSTALPASFALGAAHAILVTDLKP